MQEEHKDDGMSSVNFDNKRNSQTDVLARASGVDPDEVKDEPEGQGTFQEVAASAEGVIAKQTSL